MEVLLVLMVVICFLGVFFLMRNFAGMQTMYYDAMGFGDREEPKPLSVWVCPEYWPAVILLAGVALVFLAVGITVRIMVFLFDGMSEREYPSPRPQDNK